MNSIEVVETNTILEFPEHGTEFNKAQFLSLSKNMLLYTGGAITFQQFKTNLTYEFLGMVRTADTSKEENFQVVENVAAISKLVDAYFTEEKQEGKTVKILEMVYFTQLLPKIKVDGVVFHGPDSALFNTVFGEYIQALTMFTDYSATANEDILDRLIATLYRPERAVNDPDDQEQEYSKDPRRKFNPELTDHYAQRLKHLSPSIKYAIYLFFASCQHFIANTTDLDIGGGNQLDISILFKKQAGASTVKGLGMVGTLYSIAETKVFGNVKDVAAQNTYDVFAFLVEQHHKMEQLKKKKK